MQCFIKGEKSENMAGGLGEGLGVKEKTIRTACHVALKAHKHSEKPFIIRRKWRSSKVIFAFPGTWSTEDWFSTGTSTKQFGETKDNLEVFPSIRRVGNDESAAVNDAFLRRFLSVADKPTLQNEVENALRKNKQIIFTGHSGGGPIAIYATVWLFEYLKKTKDIQTSSLFCLTFGSPLIADNIFRHALRRENWSDHFIHFVTRYDIIPRLMLAPPTHIEQILPEMLPFFSINTLNSTQTSMECNEFVKNMFENVMRNASSVASQAACILMGSTNQLADTISSFTELSPYRPFGTYVFCYGNAFLTAKNPDAVLQLLIFSVQLSTEREGPEIALASLSEHLAYKIKLEKSGKQDVYSFEKFRELPLNSEECTDNEAQTISKALDDLGLVGSLNSGLDFIDAFEIPSCTNQGNSTMNLKYVDQLFMTFFSRVQGQGYAFVRTSCEARGVGYYDSFKLQKYQDDFLANIKRLELAGMWDEIIEMLKRHQLPDGFEGEKSWVDLGTKYRRLVEPLDIANYYRNALHADTEMYMKAGSRPKRYSYTQRWHEHFNKIPRGSSGESTFWAEVEQLRITMTAEKTPFGNVKERILELEKNLKQWYENEEVKKAVFLPESTLVQWWRTLPKEHRAVSRPTASEPTGHIASFSSDFMNQHLDRRYRD